MDSDHWKTRAKGGMLRREFLRFLAVSVTFLTAVVNMVTGVLNFSTARRHVQVPVKRRPFVFEMDGRDHLVPGTDLVIRVDVGPPRERGSAPPKIV